VSTEVSYGMQREESEETIGKTTEIDLPGTR
jgi:hypothetical protein